jgi:dTDP-4-dehydrorhamnose reductase
MAVNALLLGADGTFGHVAAKVLGTGRSMIATARRPRDGVLPFDVMQGDDDLAALLGRLQGNALIVNAVAVLAGEIGPEAPPELRERVLAINAVFPHRLARLAALMGHRVVHISTDAVFARDAGRVTETDPVAPDGFYGLTKAAGELSYPHTLTVRCSFVGPPAPGRERGLWAWIAESDRGASVRGYTNQTWSGVTSLQLAEACATLIDPATFERVRRSGAIHHLAPNPAISKYELLRMLAVALARSDLTIEPAEADVSVDRVLASRHRALDETITRYPDWQSAIAASVEHSNQ